MSVKLYDDALIKKFQNWTRNTNITITKPNETKRLFEQIADNSDDAPIKLPLLALSRPGGYSILDLAKRPLSFDGVKLDATTQTSCQLNAIPISIPYQLDIYTRYFEEADEFARNLVFNIINYPKLDVIIPYQDRNYTHDSNIRIDSGVEDNSDIPERLISGQFTRLTINLTIDDAYLFDVRYRDNYCIYQDTEITTVS